MKVLLILLTFIVWAYGQDPILTILPTTLPSTFSGGTAVYDDDDSIYLFGSTGSILKFSISAETIENVGNMSAGVDGALGFWDGTSAVIFSGNSNGSFTQNTFRYVPGLGYNPTFQLPGERLPWENWASCVAPLSNPGEAIILGGVWNGNRILKYANNMATPIEDVRLPFEMAYHSCVSHRTPEKDTIYAFGGIVGNPLNTIVQYDVGGSSHILSTKLHDSVSLSAAVFNGTYAYIIGYNGSPPNTILRFDPISKEVVTVNVNNFPPDLTYHSVAFVERLNRAYIFGGLRNQGNRTMYVTF